MDKLALFLTFLLIAISIPGCKDETQPVTPPSTHLEPEGWLIRDETMKPVLVVWQGVVQTVWAGSAISDTLFAPIDSITGHYSVRLLNSDKSTIPPPSGNDYSLTFVLADTSIAKILRDDTEGWEFHLSGKKAGTTNLEVQLLHLGHVDVRTPSLPVRSK